MGLHPLKLNPLPSHTLYLENVITIISSPITITAEGERERETDREMNAGRTIDARKNETARDKSRECTSSGPNNTAPDKQYPYISCTKEKSL